MDAKTKDRLIRVLSEVRRCDADDYVDEPLWQRGYMAAVPDAIDAIERAFTSGVRP